MVALFCSLIYLSVSSEPDALAEKNIEGQNANKKLRVLVLEGSPYNRGLIHGRALKKEIHELIGLWRNDIEKTFKVSADKFIAAFLKKTNFQKSIKRWMPEMLEEVRGIADGSGIDYDTIYLFQLPDELWANGQDVVGEHCTSIGINRRGSSPTFVAQNMDIPGFYHGYQTLLHIKDDSLESYVLTVPGMIGVNGINNHSLAITCNTLLQLQYSQDGLPVAYIVRGALKQKSLKDLYRFITEIDHASGQNYIIGGPERAYSFECSANKVIEFIPYEGAELTYHTNHPLANDDYSLKFIESLKKINKTTQQWNYFCYRLDALEKRIGKKSKATSIDIDLIKATLSSRDSESNPISNPLSYACTIMVLSASPELHIAPGRPDITPFEVFRFTDKR
jgi:hypothetical protein